MEAVNVTIPLERYTELVSLEAKVHMVIEYAIMRDSVGKEDIIGMVGGEPAYQKLKEQEEIRDKKFKTWLTASISSGMADVEVKK